MELSEFACLCFTSNSSLQCQIDLQNKCVLLQQSLTMQDIFPKQIAKTKICHKSKIFHNFAINLDIEAKLTCLGPCGARQTGSLVSMSDEDEIRTSIG